MTIFPAIDIKGGRVVRLCQGRFDAVTEYADDPAAVARRWAAAGAEWIHVVDLDGAQGGAVVNWEAIAAVAGAVGSRIQMGGGVRTAADIERLLGLGCDRVVLGTKAVEDERFLRETVARWPGQIAVSVDASDGYVTTKGWTRVSDVRAVDFVRTLAACGVTCVIYTDIARDGMMTGPNIPALRAVLDAADVAVIASGGVSSIEDVRALAALSAPRLVGVITGKALYEGTLDLKEALAVC